jgi:hypothetical protein
MQQGDSVTALYGSKWPVILRRQGDEWQFLGAAYIDGIMNGEGWKSTKALASRMLNMLSGSLIEKLEAVSCRNEVNQIP